MMAINKREDKGGWEKQKEKKCEQLRQVIFSLLSHYRACSTGVGNVGPGVPLSCRVYLQPYSKTPEKANQGLQNY